MGELTNISTCYYYYIVSFFYDGRKRKALKETNAAKFERKYFQIICNANDENSWPEWGTKS